MNIKNKIIIVFLAIFSALSAQIKNVNNFIRLSGYIAKYANTVSLDYSFTPNTPKEANSSWFNYYSVGSEYSFVKDSFLDDENYSDMKIYAINVGNVLAKRFKKNYEFDFGIKIPIGYEDCTKRYEYKNVGNVDQPIIYRFVNSKHYFIGIMTSESISYTPEGENYRLGIGVFQRLQSTYVYRFDFGVNLELGINI